MSVVVGLTQDGLKQRLMFQRGRMCEYCGQRPAIDLNHCLIHDAKRYHKALTVEENLELVCTECHQREYVHTWEHAKQFWVIQCERYGVDHMQAWLADLPLKVKPRYD